MSYDIRLKDPVTRETALLPTEHLMSGGTYAADFIKETGEFVPRPIREAWLNITYNYARYYYDATEGDVRFAHDEPTAYYADGTTGPMETEYGIRGIYGKTGAESIPMLKDVIQRIQCKYKKDGEWIETERKVTEWFSKETGEPVDPIVALLRNTETYKKEHTEIVSEGPAKDYWCETAGNALAPLYQLLAMAQLRPDCVWDGD